MCPYTPAKSESRRRLDVEQSGLAFRLARTLDDVIRAWQLVYQSYRSQGLIDSNDHGVHLVPEAIQPDSAVVVGRIQDLVASTMTIYPDGPLGLPLRHVHADKIEAFRSAGRVLVEVGLFADRRERIQRSVFALMELMRQTFFYAMHSGASDILIGVHPHHAGFYERCLAFEPFAEETGCPSVNGSPMVPMRLAIHEKYNLERLPRGLAYFKANPLEPDAFYDRVQLTSDLVAETRIDAFLQCSAERVIL